MSHLIQNEPRAVREEILLEELVLVDGQPGCGKTLFTRGICAGLDVSDRYVNSPTFVLVNEYQGRLPVFHMDLYRIEGIDQGFEIGLLDYLARAGSGVMVVEWAEKIMPILPYDCIRMDFHVLSIRKRQIMLSGSGERASSLLKGWGT